MLKCENVCKTYYNNKLFINKTAHQVLDNISFHIKQNRSVGIIGNNGAGKSTLIRLILGIDKVSHGNIYFLGENISNIGKKEIKNMYKNMQVVFQEPRSSMNPRYSVYDVISEPLKNYKYPKNIINKKVIELIELAGLEKNIINKNIMNLSGGQQQRVAIARALSIEPKLLILDEALSNLDMLTQWQIIELLLKIKKEKGICYMVVSHDIRIILKLCEDILFIEKGSVKGFYSIEEGIKNNERGIFEFIDNY